MCYHPRRAGAWLAEHGLDKGFAGAVHVCRLDDYLSGRAHWGLGGCVVHELAHAVHDLLAGGHENAVVRDRYACAVHGEGKYDSVRVKGPQGVGPSRRRRIRRRAYAAVSPQEFFAETSAGRGVRRWECFLARSSPGNAQPPCRSS